MQCDFFLSICLKAFLTQNVSWTIESFLTIQMASAAEAGLLSRLAKDPGRRAVTLATLCRWVSASP